MRIGAAALVVLSNIAPMVSRAGPGALEVDEYQGTPSYLYAFDLPPARGRYQPTLALKNGFPRSFGTLWPAEWRIRKNNGYGTGWYLAGIPYLERNGSSYEMVDGNQRTELAQSSRDSAYGYTARVDSQQISFQFVVDTKTWFARDAMGNIYTFTGRTTTDLVDRWLLQSVRDPEGNITKYAFATGPDGTLPGYVLSAIYYNAYNPAAPTSTASPGDSGYFETRVSLSYAIVDGMSTLNGVSIFANGGVAYVREYVISQVEQTSTVISGTTSNLKQIFFWGPSGSKEFVTSFEYAGESDPYGNLPSNDIQAVVTPLGLRYELTGCMASDFGVPALQSYRAIGSMSISGPGVPPRTINYWYSGPAYDAGGGYRGFTETWAQDSGTATGTHTWWETASTPFVGWAARVETGTLASAGTACHAGYDSHYAGAPPSLLIVNRRDSWHQVRSIPAGSAPCTDYATGSGIPAFGEVPAGSYPVIPYTYVERTADLKDGRWLTSERAIACADVDVWGNVLNSRVDPGDWAIGDEVYEYAAFEVTSNPAATCRNCPTWRAQRGTQTLELEATRYSYSATYQLTKVSRKVAMEPETGDWPGTWEDQVAFEYYGNGNLSRKTSGVVTTDYVYDAPYQVRVVKETLDETVTVKGPALITETQYEASGRTKATIGPYTSGSSAAPTKFYRYDERDRLVWVALAAPSVVGSTTTVESATQAFQYADALGSNPATVTSYSFAVPVSFAEQSAPTNSTARMIISYLDGFGRGVQVRERLGGDSAADPGAHVVQELAQDYRVSGLIHDAAGRIKATVAPYYSSSGAYWDMSTLPIRGSGGDALSGQQVPIHATLFTYDSRGRPTCSLRRYVASTIANAAAPCTSSFADDGNYALATMYSYATQETPEGRLMTVTVVPPENATQGSMEGTTSGYDASGLLRFTTNAAGERTAYSYDPIGRQIGTARQAPGSGRPDIAESKVLDIMGRVTSLTHPNTGTRGYTYDVRYPGRLGRVTFAGGSYIEYGYDKARVSSVRQCTVSASGTNCTTDTMTYDVASDPVKYPFTAGRMATASNSATTIALGYDSNGFIQRRDQSFSGLQWQVSTRWTLAPDGRPLQTDVYQVDSTGDVRLHYQQDWYDSAGRSVKVTGPARTYWAADQSTLTGAYDAWGSVASTALDGDESVPGGRIQERWGFKQYSGMLDSHTARSFGASSSDVYDVKATSFRGAKLEALTDNISGTSYSYWYSNAGRLVAARAIPFTATPLSQNSLVCVGYGAEPLATKSFSPVPGFGNIEIVREQSVTRKYNYPGTSITGSIPPGSLTSSGPDAVASLGSTFVGYDQFGRVSQVNDGEQFGYDLFGRLTLITRTASEDEALLYGPSGGLAVRAVDSAVTLYAGAAMTIRASLPAGCRAPSEACPVGSPEMDVHVNLGGTRLASVAASASGMGRVLYLHRDRLGSVIATTVGYGAIGVSARYRYSPHGATEVALNDIGAGTSEIGYAGALRLSGGILLMGVRAYNPALRMFMQPDPLAPPSYAYVRGDPINRIDPSGMEDEPSHKCERDCGGGATGPAWVGWASSRGWWSGYGSVTVYNPPVAMVTTDDGKSGVSIDPSTGTVVVRYPQGEPQPEVEFTPDGLAKVKWPDGSEDSFRPGTARLVEAGMPFGFLLRLRNNGGVAAAKMLRTKAEAVAARRAKQNVMVRTRQAAGEVETAVSGGSEDIIKHGGHDLPNGNRGNPHFQTPGREGHTFWGDFGDLLELLIPLPQPLYMAKPDEA